MKISNKTIALCLNADVDTHILPASYKTVQDLINSLDAYLNLQQEPGHNMAIKQCITTAFVAGYKLAGYEIYNKLLEDNKK